MAERPGWEGEEKLGGRTDGPFLMLDYTTRTLFIERRDVIERFNRDRVGWAPPPDTTATPCDAWEVNLEDLEANIETKRAVWARK